MLHRQLDAGRLPRRLYRRLSHYLPGGIIRHCFQRTGLPANVGESKQEMLAALAEAQRSAIDEQFRPLAGSHYVDGLDYPYFVVPMPDDMHAMFIHVYPAVPHHLVGEIAVFRYPHGVYLATSAVVLRTAEVGI